MLRPAVVREVTERAAGGPRVLQYVRTNDGQLGDFLGDPLVLRVGPGLPPPGRGVLDEALPVVGNAPRVPGCCCGVRSGAWPSRSGPTRSSGRLGARGAFGVERLHDLHGRAPLHVLGIDALDDASLGLVDRALAALLAVAHNVVPVAAAAGNAPGSDAADLPGGQVGRVESGAAATLCATARRAASARSSNRLQHRPARVLPELRGGALAHEGVVHHNAPNAPLGPEAATGTCGPDRLAGPERNSEQQPVRGPHYLQPAALHQGPGDRPAQARANPRRNGSRRKSPTRHRGCETCRDCPGPAEPHGSRRPHYRPKHLLSGLLVCGTCGASLIVRNRKANVDVLRCSQEINRHGCTNYRNVTSIEIEQRVLAGLHTHPSAPDVMRGRRGVPCRA